MKQVDVKEWCEAHDCYVYEQRDKEDGIYYLMRNPKDKKLMVMVFPLKEGKNYRPASVCHICNQLDIPVPVFGVHMQEELIKAKENCPKDWKNKNHD